MFDRTNAHRRFLLKGSLNLSNDLTPELLAYQEGRRTAWGANLTGAVDGNTVIYGEWSGGRDRHLIGDALDFGQRTGTLPQRIIDPTHDASAHVFNSLSVGTSYTTEDKITFNAEYHLFQPGFAPGDWRNWFSGSPPIGAAALWYLRGYAQDQQDPISRHSFFMRADWMDALVQKLELTAFVNIDAYDGSSLCQVTADYYLSDRWTIGIVASANIGAKRSDFGSLPQSTAALLKITRYF
jgi:hypothetical protein